MNLRRSFWNKFNPNWKKMLRIECIVGLLAGAIWCLFTLMDLTHGPYWSVSLKLTVLNGLYFAGKFGIGLFILLESLRLLSCQHWFGGD